MTSSVSCGSSSAPNGGDGAAGSGGASGSGGSKGTKGTAGSGGSGGAMGSGMMCKDPTASVKGLTGLSSACETCLEGMCCAELDQCQSTPGCITGVNCIISCFHKGGLLTECGTKCGPDASSTLMGVVTSAVLCAAGSCGTTTTCNPTGATKDGGTSD